MEQHNRGTLPKSYYAPNGELYGKQLFYKESGENCVRVDEQKDQNAKEKAEESIKNAPIIKKEEKLNL
jgi:hypothetical protein